MSAAFKLVPKIPKVNVGEETFAFQCRAYKLAVVEKFFLASSGTFKPMVGKKGQRTGWIFDFSIVGAHLLVEIDGGIWRAGGGAHSHPLDLTRNMHKRNDAALAGYRVVAFTPEEVKSGTAIAFVRKMVGGV
jgi:hypothetical protein